jgi:hypothetical protein
MQIFIETPAKPKMTDKDIRNESGLQNWRLTQSLFDIEENLLLQHG